MMREKAARIASGILLLLLVFLNGSVIPPYRTFDYRMGAMVAGHEFSFARWEAGAITRKLDQALAEILALEFLPRSWGGARGGAAENLAEEKKAIVRVSAVLDYISLIQQIGQLERSLQQTYSTEEDPAAVALPLRQELAALRQRQAEKQGQVEAILEEQITQILASQHLETLSIVWPPVKFQFEQMPIYLAISPRQEIRVKKGVYLEHGLGLDIREAIEEEIDEAFDVSSLTVGVGGLSAYPTMIMEAASLDYIVKVAAHEWVHGYLFFRPLGWRYDDSPQMRTINETVASIVGDEIGGLVIARFYPELGYTVALPPPVEKKKDEEEEEQPQPEPVESEFNREMRQIRLTVDEMLAQGDVAGAEEYMEERRRFLVSRGYYIRKLNQAYFAFYGAYAASPTSVDPIGEALQRLRRESDSLREFVDTVAAVASHEELWRVLGEEGTAD